MQIFIVILLLLFAQCVFGSLCDSRECQCKWNRLDCSRSQTLTKLPPSLKHSRFKTVFLQWSALESLKCVDVPRSVAYLDIRGTKIGLDQYCTFIRHCAGRIGRIRASYNRTDCSIVTPSTKRPTPEYRVWTSRLNTTSAPHVVVSSTRTHHFTAPSSAPSASTRQPITTAKGSDASIGPERRTTQSDGGGVFGSSRTRITTQKPRTSSVHATQTRSETSVSTQTRTTPAGHATQARPNVTTPDTRTTQGRIGTGAPERTFTSARITLHTSTERPNAGAGLTERVFTSARTTASSTKAGQTDPRVTGPHKTAPHSGTTATTARTASAEEPGVADPTVTGSRTTDATTDSEIASKEGIPSDAPNTTAIGPSSTPCITVIEKQDGPTLLEWLGLKLGVLFVYALLWLAYIYIKRYLNKRRRRLAAIARREARYRSYQKDCAQYERLLRKRWARPSAEARAAEKARRARCMQKQLMEIELVVQKHRQNQATETGEPFARLDSDSAPSTSQHEDTQLWKAPQQQQQQRPAPQQDIVEAEMGFAIGQIHRVPGPNDYDSGDDFHDCVDETTEQETQL